MADGDVWRGVRGRHGVGCCNEVGEKFLEFCAVNQFTVMSTWIIKKSIHLATWKHPATKQSHMIDYVVMHAEQDAHEHAAYVVHRHAGNERSQLLV